MHISKLKVPTTASLTAVVEKNDMTTEMKEVTNESEMDKWLPTAHGNECSLYELMRSVARFA